MAFPLSTGQVLLREFDAAGFAHDGDADLAGVGKLGFDLARDAAGEGEGGFVSNFIGLDEDAQFAAGLHGETFFHACKREADFFQVFHALDVGGHRLGARAGAAGADGVGGADEDAERKPARPSRKPRRKMY